MDFLDTSGILNIFKQNYQNCDKLEIFSKNENFPIKSSNLKLIIF